jgi:hypothetical protein
VLFGDRAPSGRLTQTWYRAVTDLPDLLDYDIIGSDATYLFYRGTPLYPFGHGLSYAEFDYTGVRLSADRMPADGRITATVEVRNRGERDSDEVVQLYTRKRDSRVKQPLRRLRGFRRVHVPAAAARTVEFDLPAADLACWDVVGERYVVESAGHDILLGRSSGDIRLTAGVRVDGETVPEGCHLREGLLTCVDAGWHDRRRGGAHAGFHACPAAAGSGLSRSRAGCEGRGDRGAAPSGDGAASAGPPASVHALGPAGAGDAGPAAAT